MTTAGPRIETDVVEVLPTQAAYYLLPTAKQATKCNQPDPTECNQYDWSSDMINDGPHGETLLEMTTVGMCVLTGRSCLKMAELLITTLAGRDALSVEKKVLAAKG